ncbi:MAG: hypothetical protein K6F21_02760 [Bacteroidales bacterium]|nr:hypothetical protein [Bacteroidales bacterium]
MDFGTLHLPTEAPAASPALDWWDVPVHPWLVLGCAVLILFLLPGLYRLLPSVLSCLSRSRGNLEIEHSVSLSRTRNFYSRMLVIPYIVTLDRFLVYNPDFLAGWDRPWLLLLELYLVFFGYLLLRLILHTIILGSAKKRLPGEKRLAVQRGLHNYFICFMLVMLFTLCIHYVIKADDQVFRNVFLAELALFWLISVIREGQILRSECGGLTTILYLCGLEFLPAGAVVASAVVF